MRLRILPSAWRSGPWANGGGVTHTIATWSDGAGHPLARLSVADIERAGPFSRLAGHDRWLAVLDDGGGLGLEHAGIPHHLATGAALAFAGEDAVLATPAAPARVLNLIVRRGVPWRAAVPPPSAPGFHIAFDLASRITTLHTELTSIDHAGGGPTIAAWLGHPIDGTLILDGAP